MTGVCCKCGLVFDGTDEDTSGPNVECLGCFLKRNNLPPHPDYPPNTPINTQDADLDGPDTDVLMGDDPDEYLGIPD